MHNQVSTLVLFLHYVLELCKLIPFQPVNFLHGTSDVGRVLLIGRPGCGKTILLKKITLDWTDTVLDPENIKERHKSGEIKFTSKFDFLIYIDLCKWGPNDTITDYLKLETNTEEFLNYLQEKPSKCLFLLDSWDEFACKGQGGVIVKLTNGALYQECTLITASKFMGKKSLPDYKDKTCIIQGFSPKQARNFVKGDDKILARLGVEEFYDPYMLHAACQIENDIRVTENDIPDTVCQSRLFVQIVSIMRKYANKRKKTSKQLPLETYKTELLSIGKLALARLTISRNIKRVFTEEEAEKVEAGVCSKGCDLGLLHGISKKDGHGPGQVTFPHRLLRVSRSNLRGT